MLMSGRAAPMTGAGEVTVGIDIGGTKALAVALAGNRVVAEGRVATPDGGEAVLDAIADLAVEVAGDRPWPRWGRGCRAWSTGRASSTSPPTCRG